MIYEASGNTIEVRVMRPDEATRVDKWSRTQGSLGRDSGYLWTSWAYWDKHPPVIALMDGEVVGLRSWTSSDRTKYTNGYYIMVDPRARRRGIAVNMVDEMLRVMHARGMKRHRIRAKHTSNGRAFWESLGARCIGRNSKQVWFDVDITPCDSVESFRRWMATPERHEPVPLDMMQRYLTQGMIPILGMSRRVFT